MEFHDFGYLFLLLLLIPYVVWYVLKYKTATPALKVSSMSAFRGMRPSWKSYLIHLPFLLNCIIWAASCLALARPQTSNSWSSKSVEGIDIMLCMDVSTSMLAEDLKPNRVQAARNVAVEFISGRPSDNIGLTVFAGEAYTQCPMTVDHAVLLNMLNGMSCDDSKAKSKVIILLTDGSNNRGDISPNTAADIAHSFGIRVYTIGVGTNGTAPYPMRVGGRTEYINVPVEIDTKTLASIAGKTDGEFYRATNTEKLREVYREIDKLEKTKMKVSSYSKRYEAFGMFLWIAVLALIVEILLRATVLKRIP